jgi:mannose-6-phosphate isomerase
MAEIWLGAHRLGSAMVASGEDDAGVSLREVIARNPAACCGREAEPSLPFLLKVLAVADPLSLQVHPRAELARAGYAREEAAGMAPNAPDREFKDPNPKPEMLYALGAFEALAGFKPVDTIRRLFEPLAAHSDLARQIVAALAADSASALRDAVEIALAGGQSEQAAVAELTAACRRQMGAPGDDPSPYALAVSLARRYPADGAVAVAMMMVRVSLAPGEALYLASGVPHSYLRGLGVEVMGPSDNVLRAGLTNKHKDVAALIEAIDFSAAGGVRPAVVRDGPVRLLRPPTALFQLADVRVGGVAELSLPGPRIVLALEGEVTVFSELGSLHLARGQSLFAMDSEGPLTLRGKGRLVVAAPGQR